MTISRPLRRLLGLATVGCLSSWGGGAVWAQDVIDLDPETEPLASVAEESRGWQLDWGFEGLASFRHSQENAFPVNFPFSPEQLPVGQSVGLLTTVDPGSHFEIPLLTLRLTATLGHSIEAHAKIDFIDLHERNPTSGDKDIDVDELWLRFGQETAPARLADGYGAYLKIGKFGHFERQDDRHLESYGLVSTAFNRLEDTGLEVGFDLGRHLYFKVSATQGNPVFFRDPNALAGDNGTDDFLRFPNPDPALGSGILIFYDAEVEDLDVDGKLELGAGLGWRWETSSGAGGDVQVWAYRRDLADTVDLKGTFYGGDLDLLLGPANAFPLPITNDRKEEVGGNFWYYDGGFSLFAQYVDQDLAGLGRLGYEGEVAWRFDLPVRWAVAGRQLFPSIAPAFRYSKLDPDIPDDKTPYPAPSVRWDWQKYDVGVRVGILSEIDLTLEYAFNRFVLGSGKTASNDELLTTLRWRFGSR
ncbi:MAG: hypothetical protein KDD11_22935 [Acidobacteria bacterium]|nr:hypothetical protein [Acidobacteriota bacterium]